MDRSTREEIKSAHAATQPQHHTLTLNVASPGTPVLDEEGHRHTSAAGHVYYSVSDGSLANGYGFSPIVSGMSGPGHVVRNEQSAYQNPAYSRTLEITSEQYARLKEFGEAGANNRPAHFNLYYNGADNSCIDFAWKALEYAGLKRELHILPGVQIDLPKGYEGTLQPLHNIRDIQRLVPPIPGSPLNREERHALPERTLIQKLISEQEPGRPAAPRAGESAQARATSEDPRLQQIRDGVDRLDAHERRSTPEQRERLAAGLYAAVASNPTVRAVHEVRLSTATAEHPAGRMAFAVYRPFGELAPVFHSGVDVQATLALPAQAYPGAAEQALQAQVQTQALDREPTRRVQSPVHAI